MKSHFLLITIVAAIAALPTPATAVTPDLGFQPGADQAARGGASPDPGKVTTLAAFVPPNPVERAVAQPAAWIDAGEYRYASHTGHRGGFTYQVQNLPGTVPEPERWAMLIIGFGLTGGAMRWRRRVLLRRVPAPARAPQRRR